MTAAHQPGTAVAHKLSIHDSWCQNRDITPADFYDRFQVSQLQAGGGLHRD